MTEEQALWAAVGANPADSLPRLVLADWYEERAEPDRECQTCRPKHPGRVYTGKDGMEWIDCPHCHGTGRISNGYAETAAALRATVDRIPLPNSLVPHREYWWCESDDDYRPVNGIPTRVYRRLVGEITFADLRDYPTAEAAIRDLCAAWVKVHKVEVQS